MDTSFTNGVTLTDADWFNDLNRLHYTILGDPSNAQDVRKKLWTLGTAQPSAATITPPTDGNYFHITGTTTITGFAGVISGYQVRVTFDGALTLTHNAASFILPGGTSILTVAGDSALFVNESGSNWRCLAYDSVVGSSGTPIGAVMSYAGAAAPSGWVLAFGQAISRTGFAGLFSVIGTTYGVGDGSTTFNLPDLRGRFIAGKDNMGGSTAGRLTGVTGSVTGTTLGATGGEETHLLSGAESGLQNHSHSVSGSFGVGNSAGGSTGGLLTVGGATLLGNSVDTQGSTQSVSVSIGASGALNASSAHNNVPPAIVLNYIMKV